MNSQATIRIELEGGHRVEAPLQARSYKIIVR
jgi:hypothetical protein